MKTMLSLTSKAAIFLFLLNQPITAHTCLNENGQEVDWFISIRWHSYLSPRKYIVLDSNSKKSWRWTSEEKLLKPMFSKINAATSKVLAWNDQPPINYAPSTSYAHSKGFIAYSPEEKNGFFLSHSIPKFPEINEQTGEINYVSNMSSTYGQQVVCVALKTGIEEVEKIISNVLSTKAYFYYNTLAPQLGDNSLKTAQLEQETGPLELQLGKFTYVSKPKSMKVRVFEEFLFPFWKNKIGNPGFFVETWGRPILDSVCQLNPIININFLEHEGEVQKRTQDHSKWAISSNKNFGLVCVGDLNHQSSQDQRGGSFLCLQEKEVYEAFHMLISERDCTAEKIDVSLF